MSANDRIIHYGHEARNRQSRFIAHVGRAVDHIGRIADALERIGAALENLPQQPPSAHRPEPSQEKA